VADLPPYYESLMRFYTHQPRQHNHGRAFSPGAAVVFPNLDGRYHRSFTGYPAHELDPAVKPMTAEAFKRTLDALPRRALLQLSGGIPLAPRWMRRALGSAARDRRVSLLTNGESLLPDDAALVTSRAARGLVSPGSTTRPPGTRAPTPRRSKSSARSAACASGRARVTRSSTCVS
jgi:hypothetical protein